MSGRAASSCPRGQDPDAALAEVLDGKLKADQDEAHKLSQQVLEEQHRAMLRAQWIQDHLPENLRETGLRF